MTKTAKNISAILFLFNTICLAKGLNINAYTGLMPRYHTEWASVTDFNYPIGKPLHLKTIGLGASCPLSRTSAVGLRFLYDWNHTIDEELYHFEAKTNTQVYLLDLFIHLHLYRIMGIHSSLNLMGGAALIHEDHYRASIHYSQTEPSSLAPTLGIELDNAVDLSSLVRVSFQVGYKSLDSTIKIRTIPQLIEIEGDPQGGNDIPIKLSSHSMSKQFNLDQLYLLFCISIKLNNSG